MKHLLRILLFVLCIGTLLSASATAFASASASSEPEYKIDQNYYPGHVRKAITFTLDDGNLTADKTFFSYTEPAGFKGVVNIISSRITEANKQDYINTYSDYEIGNHGKYHVHRLAESDRARIVTDAFHADTADKTKLYISDAKNKIYHIYVEGVKGWRTAMFAEDFKAGIDEGGKELEKIFGKEVTYYALPNGLQAADDGIPEYIQSLGYYAVRKTGEVGITTRFALPSDYSRLSYNATVNTLLSYGKEYDNYPDDGKLKYFCFGLHATDYNNKWDVLKEFCEKYGNRSDEFWYATDREIFDYVNAVNALEIDNAKVTNNSDLTVYIKVNGEPKTVAPHTTVDFAAPSKAPETSASTFAETTDAPPVTTHAATAKNNQTNEQGCASSATGNAAIIILISGAALVLFRKKKRCDFEFFKK